MADILSPNFLDQDNLIKPWRSLAALENLEPNPNHYDVSQFGNQFGKGMGGIRGILSWQYQSLFADPSDLHEGPLGNFLRD